MSQLDSSNPLEQFPVATRLAAYATQSDLARMCQVSRLWRQVAQREIRLRRLCPLAKHGLLVHEWPAAAAAAVAADESLCRLANKELAEKFNAMLKELRADWHSPCRLLAFCDTDFLKSSCASADEDNDGPAPAKRCRRGQKQAQSEAAASCRNGNGGSHLQALKAFASAELPPGARLHLASSFAGAIGTPADAAGVPVEMETGRSSDARQMHGLAHVRLYTCPNDPRQFGVASAGEPLPPGAKPKLLLALPSVKASRFGCRGQPEHRLLAEHPDLIVCGGLCRGFYTVASDLKDANDKNPNDEDNAKKEAGIDHSRLVFYGERLRVMSAFVTDAEDLEATLRSLNASALQPLLPGRCLAFLFICCAKGSKHYFDAPDVETAAFRRVLPGVPVLGLFSAGEFSRNCSPGQRFADIDSPPLNLRGYRTSLCVLSWS